MLHHTIRFLTIACPFVFVLAACDEEASPATADDDEVEFRTCPADCPKDYGNTSYAGQWPLANFNTVFGVPATNQVDGQTSDAKLTGAVVWHNGAFRTATQIEVTADGELRLYYNSCAGGSCYPVLLTGAELIGAELQFQFLEDSVPAGNYWVKVHDYEAQTIHEMPGHVYTLTTNAPNQTPEVGKEEHYLCYRNEAGEASRRSVFLPGVQLNPDLLRIDAATNGAIIACETGASGKMVIGYGYHPAVLATPNRYTGALKMTTADICGTGHTYTTPGRLISIEDSLGVNSWSGSLTAREGDYDHTGMICRGQYFRGTDAVPLDQMVLLAPCLQEMLPCDSELTPGPTKTTFGVMVEGIPQM